MKRSKASALLGASICLLAMTLMACAPQTGRDASTTGGDMAQTGSDEATGFQSTFTYDPTGPVVRVLEDGTLVQRTPNMHVRVNENGVNWSDYNVQFLAGDTRGCGACHEDLAATLQAIPNYEHLLVNEGVPTELTIQQCRLCHYQGNSHDSIGQVIHATHNIDLDGDGKTNATCFNCHSSVSTSPTVDSLDSMPLWDDVKHKEFRGITDVADVEGEFASDQTTLTTADQHFNLWWLDDSEETAGDVNRNHAKNGDPLDEELFNNWEIAISGEVQQETSFKLVDLINEGLSETRVMKKHCAMNPMGGSMIENSEVTGIPVRAILDKVSLKDTAHSFNFINADGSDGLGLYASYGMQEFDGLDPILVYEVNGERLSWDDGYPLQVWLNGMGGNSYIKGTCEIVFSDKEVAQKPEGDRNPPAEGVAKGMDKPNVGIFHVVEGQCVQAGEAFTFEGYADAFDETITAVEFSMDQGETWTTYEVPSANNQAWVHWTWTWQVPESSRPEAQGWQGGVTSETEVDGSADTAYVLQVRAVTNTGRVSPCPIEVMINAKGDLEQFRAQVTGEEA